MDSHSVSQSAVNQSVQYHVTRANNRESAMLLRDCTSNMDSKIAVAERQAVMQVSAKIIELID